MKALMSGGHRMFALQRLACAVCLLLIPISLHAQGLYRPNADELRSMKEFIEADALERAAILAAREAAATLGVLGPEANEASRRWSEAVLGWKKEKGAGAGPLLAEGVLFDCLGRMRGVKTRLILDELSVPFFHDLAAARPARAVKAFDAALKRDPDLIEARLRSARIRALNGDARAMRELEMLAAGANDSPFTYLAAMSRAEAARATRDRSGALTWYRRALTIYPRSAAAAIGLAGLDRAMPVAFERLDTNDLYYAYPCTILTADIHSALSARVRAISSK